MTTDSDKVTSLRKAVARYVPHGAHLSIGGFTINRNPMAAVYEIIRQKIGGLHLYATSNGQGVDELIGAGCVARLEIAYAGSGRFAPTCVRFRKAVEEGRLLVEDYTNYQMTLRFMAGAMGVPFLPTRSGLGSDVVDQWGFDRGLRAQDKRLPQAKLIVMDNPFGTWTQTPKVVLVPAIEPDVTIIHVQAADAKGNARIQGLPFADVEQVKAARHVIITCEQLVPTDNLQQTADLNQIPSFHVDAVVPLPHGAYPTACYRCYDYDPIYLNAYREAALDDARYQRYLKQYVYDLRDHQALLKRIGATRLEAIQADPRTGYARGLKR